MENLEGQDHLLDGNYSSRKDASHKCILVGKGRGYQVVGIQDGGMCVGSPTMRDFNKYGISHDCKKDGKGGPWATEVIGLTWKLGRLNEKQIKPCSEMCIEWSKKYVQLTNAIVLKISMYLGEKMKTDLSYIIVA